MPGELIFIMQNRMAGDGLSNASCPQSPIENQADSIAASRQIPAFSLVPRVHKPKKPNDDFPLQKNNIAQPSLQAGRVTVAFSP